MVWCARAPFGGSRAAGSLFWQHWTRLRDGWPPPPPPPLSFPSSSSPSCSCVYVLLDLLLLHLLGSPDTPGWAAASRHQQPVTRSSELRHPLPARGASSGSAGCAALAVQHRRAHNSSSALFDNIAESRYRGITVTLLPPPSSAPPLTVCITGHDDMKHLFFF